MLIGAVVDVTAPPSYAECVTGKVDIREDGDSEYTHGDLNFAPAYTYYSWDQGQGQGPPAGQGQTNGAQAVAHH